MARSGDPIDLKVFEADFFLDKMNTAGTDFLAVRFYFSAFVSASRSITFALQAVLSEVDGFEEWYRAKQDYLRSIPIARFFVAIRNESQKIGHTPINAGTYGPAADPKAKYFFSGGFEGDPSLVPATDVVTACSEYLTLLIGVIFDAYTTFDVLSPVSFFSVDSLRRHGMSIEEVEEALGLPRGWSKAEGYPDDARLDHLRASVPDTAIDRIFLRYLKKARPRGDAS